MIHERLLTSVRDYEERFRKPAPSLRESWLATMTDAQRRSCRIRSSAACAGAVLAACVTLPGAGPGWSLIAFANPVKAIWC